jgi:hypothetical protein
LSLFGPISHTPSTGVPDVRGALLAIALIVIPWSLIVWMIWTLS